ncbi:MAG TPA: PTS sugar transporter subunit IIA [Candidatus Omnitrophota bacterium]|nr:PTS sugar transporter subunit IIA [Candidatus Omnitrophota bacterium]HPT07450.1 PTS sugar transporter subunit IIA [Candidatus Omnitrophota bacterium]
MVVKKSETVNLISLLKDKGIVLELEGDCKKKILAELAAIAGQSSKMLNEKGFLKIMIERESLGSTGIGNGVAIPHAKSKYVKDFILVFARKSGGIDFGALDGERTYLFFALASPQEKVGMHLKILAEISHLVKDKFIVDRLRQAKDKKEILKVIAVFNKKPA